MSLSAPKSEISRHHKDLTVSYSIDLNGLMLNLMYTFAVQALLTRHAVLEACCNVQRNNISLKPAIWALYYLHVFRSMDSCSSRPGPDRNTPDHMAWTRGVHFNVHPSNVLISWTKLY